VFTASGMFLATIMLASAAGRRYYHAPKSPGTAAARPSYRHHQETRRTDSDGLVPKRAHSCATGETSAQGCCIERLERMHLAADLVTLDAICTSAMCIRMLPNALAQLDIRFL
jgi:hypothetical protein